jgi:hypothetical protein
MSGPPVALIVCLRQVHTIGRPHAPTPLLSFFLACQHPHPFSCKIADLSALLVPLAHQLPHNWSPSRSNPPSLLPCLPTSSSFLLRDRRSVCAIGSLRSPTLSLTNSLAPTPSLTNSLPPARFLVTLQESQIGSAIEFPVSVREFWFCRLSPPQSVSLRPRGLTNSLPPARFLVTLQESQFGLAVEFPVSVREFWFCQHSPLYLVSSPSHSLWCSVNCSLFKSFMYVL